ncbi:hypothetical protein [Streptomyces sp. CBMA29]|uniref:hypothetical protein n=1 Tax=Streptomyces sp. CBMA29 TaxID=1896314 RepID=UPI001661AFD9|nr:hypothetical protein [Streptomyces sp. CBMA29]MBD0737215.1 hypothetical protein [Streptomyces sp. CBMA29]
MRRTLLLSTAVAAAALTVTALTGCGGNGGAKASSKASGGGTAGTAGTSAGTGAPENNPAGDIPDNQAYVVYAPAGQGFSVKVPEGWARTDAASSVTFTDKLNRITVAPGTAGTAPTPRSVTARVVPALKGQVPGFAGEKASTVPRRAGSVVLLTYRGDTAPDPVTGKAVHDAFERYAFFRGGQEVDLTLSGPVGADNVDPWRIVTDSFTWQ